MKLSSKGTNFFWCFSEGSGHELVLVDENSVTENALQPLIAKLKEANSQIQDREVCKGLQIFSFSPWDGWILTQSL